MIIVHHLDDLRSQRILWLQEELGLSYEIRKSGVPLLARTGPVGPVYECPFMGDRK